MSTSSRSSGATYAADTKADYVLGQAGTERARLDAQHEVAWQAVGSKSAFMVPVNNSKKLTAVLDLGCGTAVWLKRAAGDAPRALLYGFDLSAAKFPSAFDDQTKAGCQGRLLLGTQNALKDWPKGLLGQFDVVNCLFFMLWIPREQWPVLLDNIKALLKPGGWLQVLDPSFDPAPALWKGESAQHALGSEVWDSSMRAYMASPQVAFGEVKKLPSLLKSLGFKRVEGRPGLSLKLGQAQPDETLREVSKSILLPNVAKGREAGICAKAGETIRDGVIYPSMEDHKGWDELMQKLEAAFEAGAEVPCMAVCAQKKKSFIQGLVLKVRQLVV